MPQVMTNAQREQQVADEDRKAAEEMAQMAQRTADEDVDNPVGSKESTNSNEEVDGIWEDLLNEDEDTVDEEQSQLDDDDIETPQEKAENEAEGDEPSAEETDEQQATDTSVEDETSEGGEEAADDEVEIPPIEEPQDTRSPEEVKAEIEKARENARSQLRERFKMTEEQADEFERNPAEALANMAADMYLDIYDTMLRGFQGMLPGMVESVMANVTNRRMAEQKFYKAWPQLAKKEYRATVDRIAETYRQSHPSVDAETAVKEIGAQAWVALRLPLDELIKHTQGAPSQEQTPVVNPPTHTPAGAGNAPVGSRKPVQRTMNEYEQLAEEFLNDE